MRKFITSTIAATLLLAAPAEARFFGVMLKPNQLSPRVPFVPTHVDCRSRNGYQYSARRLVLHGRPWPIIMFSQGRATRASYDLRTRRFRAWLRNENSVWCGAYRVR